MAGPPYKLARKGATGAKKLLRKGATGEKKLLRGCCCGNTGTCDCFDSVCCWRSSAKVTGTWTYEADIYAIGSHFDEDLGYFVADVDCSGDDENSSYLYTVTISWNYTALRAAADGSGDAAGCCKFQANGFYCSGSGGASACPDPPANSPGLTVTITSPTGPVTDFRMGLSISLYPGCGCAGWKVGTSWQLLDDVPDVMRGGCPLRCILATGAGHCSGFADAGTCSSMCHEGIMGLSVDNEMNSAWRAYDETGSISGTVVDNNCCRDTELSTCKTGAAGENGECNPLP
jgi:hypothetical protein